MISIIIIVKDDREIEDTINSLQKTKKPEKTEIIVIDASKKETLLDIKKKFQKIRWFYYENKGGKKITIPEQRNIGIKKSKGDIIAFIDAGCIVKKNWLIELIHPLRKEKENFVVGRIFSKKKSSMYENSLSHEGNKYLNTSGTANTAFKKSILNNVELFDTNFNYGSDTEFSWRVIKAGYRLRFIPTAIIFISWGNFRQDIKRALKYGEARPNLYIKHPDRIKSLFIYKDDFYTLYAFFFFIYIISIPMISFFWPYYIFFLLFPFIVYIKHQPLKRIIYDFFFGYGIIKRIFEVTILGKTKRFN